MKKGLMVLLIFVLIFGLIGCSTEAPEETEEQEEQTGEETEEQADEEQEIETLKVGTSADFPPFESMDIVDGKDVIVGFDIDLVNEIAKELNMEVEVENITFDGLVDAVKTNKINMAISGMNPTPDRLEKVNFSDPYYYASQTILVKEDAEDIVKMEELNGKIVGSQLGSTSDDVISEYEDDGVEVKKYDLVPDAVQDLKNGRIDGVIVEDAVAGELVNEIEGIKVVIPEEFKVDAEPFGIVLSKENEELLEKVNNALKSIIDSGKYDELLKKHGLANTL